jgi:hypothetical protein
MVEKALQRPLPKNALEIERGVDKEDQAAA